jgi:hypothetical protein
LAYLNQQLRQAQPNPLSFAARLVGQSACSLLPCSSCRELEAASPSVPLPVFGPSSPGHGARTGEWSPLMAQVVSNLDQEDMLAIVAYLASLDP